MLTKRIIAIILLTALVNIITCRQVTISNVIPRRDTDGNIMDAHDGNVFLHDGLYYYYDASYGLCKEPPGPSGCIVWHQVDAVSDSIIMLVFILHRILPFGQIMGPSFQCLQ